MEQLRFVRVSQLLDHSPVERKEEMQMNETPIRFFIGVPELAKRIHQTRQTVHYRAANGQLHVKAYPLRTGRRITFIFDEAEVNAYLKKSETLWTDRRYREEAENAR